MFDQSFYTNKKVLILGGTGTVGGVILSKLVQDESMTFRVFSRDEFKQSELADQYRGKTNIRYLIGDIRDVERLKRAMEDIDIVFHCSAMKHVTSCEYNPFEAVLTNVLGTQNVIRAAIEMNVKHVLFTSSDKAINPTNVYGASKLMAERLIRAAQGQRGPNSDTTFSSVRFGNIIGSRGSVVPRFVKQILTRREVNYTSLEMSRFMMNPTDAFHLLSQSLIRSKGGEVIILKMPVVTLKDLIDVVIELTCEKYAIAPSTIQRHEIGLQPGEKLYEELMTVEESYQAYELPDMFVLPHQLVSNKFAIEGTKPSIGSYRSIDQPAIGADELRNWIISENII